MSLDRITTFAFEDFAAAKPENKRSRPTSSWGRRKRKSDINPESVISRLSNRLKRIALNGKGKKKKNDDSRSSHLFDLICNMMREGFSRDEIEAVITSRRYAISKSVLEKPKPHDYAKRQIEKAVETVDQDELRTGRVAPNSGALVLDPSAPMKSAGKFQAEQRPNLMHFQDSWLDFRDGAYCNVESNTIKSAVYEFLDAAMIRSGKGGLRPFNPTISKVQCVTDALRAVTHRPRDQFDPPCWLEEDHPDIDPQRVIVCRNGILDLATEELLEHTPLFFTRNGLEFDYDGEAPTPKFWHRFLASLRLDPEVLLLAQEIFGYLLVCDTSQQKIFICCGPPRSGKGTIARILAKIIGARNTCAPTFTSLGENFGLQSLIGKTVAILSDVRIGNRANVRAIVENLLRISGEDLVNVPRKYKSDFMGTLNTRFLLISNELPGLSDASGALANRLVPLVLTESFLGREDPTLTSQLSTELPGILNWAIEGWQRLQDRGYFKLPRTSIEALGQVQDLSSPLKVFVRENCALDANSFEYKADVYRCYRVWCDEMGMKPQPEPWFARNLYAATGQKVVPGKRKPSGATTRSPTYEGLCLSANSSQHFSRKF